MSLSQIAALLNGASSFSGSNAPSSVNPGVINIPQSIRGGDSMNVRTGFRIVPPTGLVMENQSSQATQYPFSHDIIEDEDKIRIVVDAPGFSTHNMSFMFTEDGDPSLTIERTNEYPSNTNNIINRRFGRYVITWPIHTRIQLLAHPHWSFEQGVLTLEFDKRDDIRGVPLNINTLPTISINDEEVVSDMDQVPEEEHVPELEDDEE
uniref:Small heat shock protein Hsp26 n=1 Tax=Clandestinovirus TaxID=2831644 RepID=A0A8F8KU03_9VIRU|nr:small heat shock protein Hsp26 [Clandestinovirus]